VLAQLRAFLIALEEGSLNRAATRLHTSQSALSRQMQTLEAEIGGPLLERTASGVRPTDAGHALASSLPSVLAQYDAAIAEARRLARGQRDLIRVGYLGSAAQIFLDPALFALRRVHREVKVKLLDLSAGEQIAALRKGEIDLALIGQEGALLSTEFYTRKLTTLPVVAVMPCRSSVSLEKTDFAQRTLRRTVYQFTRGRRAGARPLDHPTLSKGWIPAKIRAGSGQPFQHVYADRKRRRCHISPGLSQKLSCRRCCYGATLGYQSHLGFSRCVAAGPNREIAAYVARRTGGKR
jgi:DNA-binding transcriptional LysR family regulator